ncbi:MAG: hypothetical protein AAGE84_31070 [Cyanobacteria bacterium P01_G01_bin.39]
MFVLTLYNFLEMMQNEVERADRAENLTPELEFRKLVEKYASD